MAPFYQQGLVLFTLLMVMSECGDVPLVRAPQEEDVVLPCFNSNEMDPKSCYRVKWMKIATDAKAMKVILARPKTPNIQDAERVKWEADANGQMSLVMTKVQKSDEGLYSCEIWQGWDSVLVRNTSLKIKECKVIQSVRAAPGTPINLTCPVDVASGLQASQNISWAMLKGGNPVPVISERVEINVNLFSIQSVKYSDSSWYRCKYMLGQTLRCFDMNLQVQVENAVLETSSPAPTVTEIMWETKKDGSSGTFITVVTSVIIGFALTAALIGLFVYRHCKASQPAAQQRWRPADIHADIFHGYDTVDFTSSDDTSNQRINSLYSHSQEESLCTF